MQAFYVWGKSSERKARNREIGKQSGEEIYNERDRKKNRKKEMRRIRKRKRWGLKKQGTGKKR